MPDYQQMIWLTFSAADEREAQELKRQLLDERNTQSTTRSAARACIRRQTLSNSPERLDLAQPPAAPL